MPRITWLIDKQATGLFVLLLLSFAYFFPHWADWNQNSRFALVKSLVEEHSLVIDHFYQDTGDYAIYGNHKYTDKAPGLSFLGAPIYAGFRTVTRWVPGTAWTATPASNSAFSRTLRPDGTGLQANKIEDAAALYVVTFFVVSLPAAALWVLVYCFLGDLGFSRRVRLGVPLALGLATVAFPYSSAFYSHQTASFLLFAAFYLLFLIKHGRLPLGALWGVGAVLGLAGFTDFPAVIPAGLLLVYAWSFLRSGTRLLQIIGGALPFALALGVYNQLCFGSPFHSSYRYLALFQAQSNYGILGFSLPTWQAFWGITFSSYRGLFFSSPFLLATIPGAWLARGKSFRRAELLLSISVIVAYLALISCYYDWKGGFSIAGPRNLIPMIPFMALPVACGLEVIWRSVFWRGIVIATFAWSFAAIFIQTAAGQAFAPISIPSPLFEFFLPALLAGDINRNVGMILRLSRWYSLVPLLVGTGLVSAWLFAKEGTTGESRT
ncbi:MAG TPA: hypothetical protein VFZ25_02245 [Chloroflexota bacterium]|nr:hypothetical protein [Chloroflexota bacterium]